jgi:hypothetical protein
MERGCNRSFIRLLACGVLAMSLAACASQALTNTGFLRSYGDLQPIPSDANLLQARAAVQRPVPGALAQYASVLIEPVVVTAPGLDDEQAGALAAALQQALTTEIGRTWPLAQQGGAGVLRVRAAITGVTKSNVVLNVITTAAAAPLSNGGAAGEAEIVDARTGQRVAALTWADVKRLSDPLGYYSETGHARALMSDFGAEIANLIAR